MIVWQELLLQNFSSKIVTALKAMYNVVKVCIRQNQSYSDFISSHFVIKQGDPSSPMICMMFMNGITQSINSNLNDIFTFEDVFFYCSMRMTK